MMDFIMVPLIFGIVTYGIYSLFELFVRKKERLIMIEKLQDKLSPEMLGQKIKLPDLSNLSFKSFGALKAAAIFIGLGAGLLIGFFIAETMVDMDSRRAWETAGTIYAASILLCTGLTLLIAFLIEYNLNRKDKK